ncbi:MAG: hypothetical protein QM813_21430 [Verrucomicrobiota bacterium]
MTETDGALAASTTIPAKSFFLRRWRKQLGTIERARLRTRPSWTAKATSIPKPACVKFGWMVRNHHVQPKEEAKKMSLPTKRRDVELKELQNKRVAPKSAGGARVS